MARQVLKVKREKLEECMTCPICKKIMREATTISLCLHTYCRKCIYEKLSEEEVDCCPVCNINLGCLPVEKLRPDHNLQDIREKIFPFRRRKITAQEVLPPVSVLAKRKERSLSSLVVCAPKVSMQTSFTGRRTKTGARKAGALRGCSFTVDKHIKKETSVDDNSLCSSSPGSSNIIAPTKTKGTAIAESSRKHRNNEENVKSKEGKFDLWTPLNCLVEAANRTKSSKIKPTSQSLATSESPNVNPEFDAKGKSSLASFLPKSKPKVNVHEVKLENDKNGTALVSESVKRRRLHPTHHKRTDVSGMVSSTQDMVDVAGARSKRKNGPIWFSLVASDDQKGETPLPQISSCYLRMKDGTLPVSFIQRYLVKKLDLDNEAEVEIMCRGQPVLPSLQLHNLVEHWFQNESTKRARAVVGGSAKDFIMVLSYCRKA